MTDTPRFRPSGIVTFTTDFGQRDPFVGVMKGRVLGRHASATLVDLMHEVSPQDVDEGGFWLARSYRDFPPGTVHVAVVDPGVGTSRPVTVVEAHGHVLLAPDNGLLVELVDQATQPLLRHLDPGALAALGIGPLSATFHGRDLFAPLAGELAAGRVTPGRLGPVIEALAVRSSPRRRPVVGETGVEGSVVTIDRFGNLITDIEGEWVARFASRQVRVGTQVVTIGRTYADCQGGDYLALVNAFGVLEIARANGNAAASLGLGRGTTVVLEARQSP
jgi:hypothetical protein